MLEIRARNDGLEQAPHLTLTKVIRRDNGIYYGFAITKDGETAYVPTHVCARYSLTAADVGAGFRAMLQRESQSAKGRAQWRVQSPVLFDDKTPQMAAGSLAKLHKTALSVGVDTGSDPDLDEDLEALLDAVDDVLSTHDAMCAGVSGPVVLSAALLRLKAVVDDRFPAEEGAAS